MTQIEAARRGDITPEMQYVANREQLDAELIRIEVAAGRMVIPANKVHLKKRLELHYQGNYALNISHWEKQHRALLEIHL